VELKIGDIVARRSYNRDVFFKVDGIVKTESGETRARLRGLDVRLMADSPLEDLVKVEDDNIYNYRKRFIKRNNECLKRIFARRANGGTVNMNRGDDKSPSDFFDLPGRVLHVDGNSEYLRLCAAIYEQLGITARGIHIPEKDQPASLPEFLKDYNPDILVLTGHDGIIKSSKSILDISNYHNSRHFVEGVKAARHFKCNKDDLVIFAGACQSHYEALLGAGANFASSPLRVFIHAFDPVFIVEKIAFAPINQTVSVNDVIENTITGTDGLGGIDTWGKYRKGFPRSRYQSQIQGTVNIMN